MTFRFSQSQGQHKLRPIMLHTFIRSLQSLVKRLVKEEQGHNKTKMVLFCFCIALLLLCIFASPIILANTILLLWKLPFHLFCICLCIGLTLPQFYDFAMLLFGLHCLFNSALFLFFVCLFVLFCLFVFAFAIFPFTLLCCACFVRIFMFYNALAKFYWKFFWESGFANFGHVTVFEKWKSVFSLSKFVCF